MKHNPFTRFVPVFERPHKTNYRALFFWGAFVILGLCACLHAADAEPLNAPTVVVAPEAASLTTQTENPPETPKTEQPKAVKAPISGAQGYTMTTGAFSDVECGSNWCNRHEPKGNQVALNLRKWPGAKEVFIPAFGKTYRVVGNTYSETGNHLDLEIWHGDDQEAALQYGIKELLVNVIK